MKPKQIGRVHTYLLKIGRNQNKIASGNVKRTWKKKGAYSDWMKAHVCLRNKTKLMAADLRRTRIGGWKNGGARAHWSGMLMPDWRRKQSGVERSWAPQEWLVERMEPSVLIGAECASYGKRRQLTEATVYIYSLLFLIFTYGRDTSIMMRHEVNYLDIAPPTLKCSTGWNIQASVTSWTVQTNE